jgi:hypothetical protein
MLSRNISARNLSLRDRNVGTVFDIRDKFSLKSKVTVGFTRIGQRKKKAKRQDWNKIER